MKSKYLVRIILILIGINLILLYKNWMQYQLRNVANYSEEPLILNLIPKFRLQDLDGKSFTSQDVKEHAPTLLVFFSLGDCPACLAEKELWIKIYQDQRVKIIGIARHSDLNELKKWVENSGIFFPVLFDKDSKVTESFRINQTHLKILVNKKGEVLMVDRARMTRDQQEKFLEKLNQMLDIKK